MEQTETISADLTAIKQFFGEEPTGRHGSVKAPVVIDTYIRNILGSDDMLAKGALIHLLQTAKDSWQVQGLINLRGPSCDSLPQHYGLPLDPKYDA